MFPKVKPWLFSHPHDSNKHGSYNYKIEHIVKGNPQHIFATKPLYVALSQKASKATLRRKPANYKKQAQLKTAY
jgi:hypothetical protein